MEKKKKKVVLRKEEEVKQEAAGQCFFSFFFFCSFPSLNDVSVGFILLSDQLSPTTPGTKTYTINK